MAKKTKDFSFLFDTGSKYAEQVYCLFYCEEIPWPTQFTKELVIESLKF